MADQAKLPGSGPSPEVFERALDNPVWSALTGPQSAVAAREGQAARFAVEISVFAALADQPGEAAWTDAAKLPGADAMVVVAPQSPPPSEWEILARRPGIQMLAQDLEAEPDAEAVPLGPEDISEVLALISKTRPGPFLARTIELGDYLGIRRDGVLVAMAGERLHLPGWTEVSAVCTDESVRGSGLASRLVRAVAAGIRARGDEVLLHVASTNTTAISLYRTLGFVERREIDFVLVRAPATSASPSDPG